MDTDSVKRPSLSVVLPNYNDSAIVGDALEAILSQTRRSDEVIVVDDASTDDSLKILERFAQRDRSICIVRSARNTGPVLAADRGLERARGDYVYFASADHRIHSRFFERSLEILARHPGAGFCQTDYESFEGQPFRFYLSPEPAYLSPQEALEKSARAGYWPGSGCSQILRRDAIREAGGIQPELRGLLDNFLSLVIAVRRGFCYVPEALMSIKLRRGNYGARLARWSEQREVGEFLWSLLDSPAYADVRAWIKEADVWPPLQPYLIYSIVRESRRWDLLSFRTARRAAWEAAKLLLGPRVSWANRRSLAAVRDRIRAARSRRS